MVLATVTDLRLFQWGRETHPAVVNLTIATLVTANDTMTIGTKVYTYLASGANEDGEINIGADAAASRNNTIAAINGTDGWNIPHVQVTAGAASGNIIPITSRVSSTSFNSVATTETYTAGGNVFSAVTLTGGLSAGTAVPATSKMLVADWDAEPADNVYHPPLLRGLIQRWKGGEIVVERGTKWTIPETPAFYEQITNWLSMSVRGGVLPTGTGPYVYTFTRDPTGNPNLDTWTIERRLTDGVYPIDQETAYSMLAKIGWKAAQSTPVTMTAEGFARRLKSSAAIATVTLTITTNPTAGDTMVIGSRTYTFRASGAVANEINIGTDVAASRVSIVAAINGSDGINTAHPQVSIANFSGTDAVISARVGGSFANSFATTETFTAGGNVFNHATLTGGVDTGLTPALSAPVGEALLSSSSKVYIDDTWAGLGGTQVQSQILNWEISFMTGYAPLFTTDGRADLDFTTAAISSENTQLEVKITMLIRSESAGGQFQVEESAAESQSIRAVRIQCDGTSGKQVQWDMLLKHNEGSLFKVGTFEGQDIIEMTLVETTDGTNLFSVKATNTVPAII